VVDRICFGKPLGFNDIQNRDRSLFIFREID
jgi:hypothetical protein